MSEVDLRAYYDRKRPLIIRARAFGAAGGAAVAVALLFPSVRAAEAA